jgi:quinol monooxygenase YgiN
MSGEVVYVDRFEIREGKTEDFRRYADELIALAADESGVSSLNYFTDEDGTRGTAVIVFADGAALDRYLDLVSPKFGEGVELVTATQIELLGDVSDRAAEMAKSFGGSVKRTLTGLNR